MNTKIKHCKDCGVKLKVKVHKLLEGQQKFECKDGEKINDAWMCNSCIAEIKEE